MTLFFSIPIVIGLISVTIGFVVYAIVYICVQQAKIKADAEIEKEKLKSETEIYTSRQATELSKKLLDVYKEDLPHKDVNELIQRILIVIKTYRSDR